MWWCFAGFFSRRSPMCFERGIFICPILLPRVMPQHNKGHSTEILAEYVPMPIYRETKAGSRSHFASLPPALSSPLRRPYWKNGWLDKIPIHHSNRYHLSVIGRVGRPETHRPHLQTVGSSRTCLRPTVMPCLGWLGTSHIFAQQTRPCLTTALPKSGA